MDGNKIGGFHQLLQVNLLYRELEVTGVLAIRIIILEFHTMTMYQLNPKEKTYIKVTRTEMEQMTEGMTEDTQVTPTNVTKKIAGYKCRKYKLTTMGVESEHWLSKDVKGYKEYRAINEKMLKKNPKLRKMNIAGTWGKEGFPVKTMRDMMGMKMTSTLKKIEKKSLRKDLFKVPRGYQLKEVRMPK